jgi:kumamolisin
MSADPFELAFPQSPKQRRRTSMKIQHSIASLVIAGALFVSCASTASAQSARRGGGASVTIPASSIAHPVDTGKRAHTNVRFLLPPAGTSALNGGPPFPGLFYEDPASLACIYNLTSPPPKDKGCNPNDTTLNNPSGGGRALAIVDAFDDPNASSDLAAFSSQFGVAAHTSFSVVYAPSGALPPGTCTGAATQPSQDPTGGWEVEESLDIEMAHSMAPGATLYLVEAQSNSFLDLFCAVTVAGSLVNTAGGGEVSMSWGGGEFPNEASGDGVFTTPNVVYFASSGDSPGVLYPAASPNVVSVGGTSLSTDVSTGDFMRENTWQDAGGGPSAYEARPSYQRSGYLNNIIGTQRGTPDVASDANPNTGVWVLDNFVAPDFGSTECGGSPCWLIVGGTGVAAPTWAGIVNAAGAFSASSTAELTKLYGDGGGDFNNIKLGDCGPYMGYSAGGPPWNFCGGLGSPNTYKGK